MVNGNCKRWVRGMGSQAVKAQHRLTEEDRLAGLSTEGGKPGGGASCRATHPPDPSRTTRAREQLSGEVTVFSSIVVTFYSSGLSSRFKLTKLQAIKNPDTVASGRVFCLLN